MYASSTSYVFLSFKPVKALLGGGQDAMSVTTTSLRQGKFETRFWHKVFEEEVGRVKGHFGPINTLS
jgi:translation initiation factor 3 subunit I